jgi:U2 small nuclear ribonucleoprotein B''
VSRHSSHCEQRVTYAKSKSDAIAKEDGSYVPRSKRTATEEGASSAKRSNAAVPAFQSTTEGGAPAALPAGMAGSDEPNSILFLQNLSPETTADLLRTLFAEFPGFKEVRLIPGRVDIAFVEFSDEAVSTTAKSTLNGFMLTPGFPLHISFAKK